MGAVLHANYIEALLDQRYYVPIGRGLSISLLVAGMLVIQMFFWRTPRPERALGIGLIALVAAAGVGYLALIQFQYIIPPVFELVGVLVFLLLRYVDSRAHSFHQHSSAPPPPGLSSQVAGSMDPAHFETTKLETRPPTERNAVETPPEGEEKP